jgi:hypothetical protein
MPSPYKNVKKMICLIAGEIRKEEKTNSEHTSRQQLTSSITSRKQHVEK